MFDKIIFISDHAATIKLKDSQNITMNLMNLHIVFEDATKKVLGEVNDVDGDTVKASFLGEIVDGRFLGGTIRKPRLDAKIRVINDDEILLITGKDEQGYMPLGNTPFYEGKPVYLDVNSFFSGHFAIMGNSGSGKSCGISRLFQNMFHDARLNPCNANIIMIDSSGEYYNAFSDLNTINPSYHYRFITTNDKDTTNEKLKIPIYLLNEADLALLLQCTSHSQLPIVERMRKLALVFSQKDMDANNYKNHLIAKAIMTILYTNESGPNKRNEIFSVLASCSTPQFNLEAVVQGIGYTRKFRECFLIDNSGNFSESVLITEYVSSFIDDKLDAYEPSDGVFYTLETLEKALNFTLISEGWLRNKNTYGDAVTLKVRLHSLIVSNNAKFFDVKQYMTVEEYLKSLVNAGDTKYQFVNINLDDVDDDFAKVITKIYSRLIFDYSKGLSERASNPFHLVIEEAHRYIQNDNDRFLIGYNIFERIAKEGRKYGVILGIITQRPVELSDTVISQCSNFLIFKMNHPVDVEYIRKMVPNISDEIVEKQKTLQSGTCLGFGAAFRIPMIVKMEMPNPAPWSGNCDVVSFWGGGSATGMMSVPDSNMASTPSVPSSSLFSPLNDVTPPTNTKEETTNTALVDLKVDNPEEPSMHAGEFGLVEVEEVEEKEEEIKVPTTDTGVSLVNLSGPDDKQTEESNVTTANEIVIPTAPKVVENIVEEKIATVNFADPAASKPLVDTDMQAPSLVSFNPGSVPVKEEPKEEVKPTSPVDLLVSFNTPVNSASTVENSSPAPSPTPAASGLVPPSGGMSFNPIDLNQPAPSALANVSSAPSTMSVMAAPTVDTNVFENTGTGDIVDNNNNGINFTNNEPSSLMGNSFGPTGGLVNLNSAPQAPNLVNLNSAPQAQGLVNLNSAPAVPSSPNLVDFGTPANNGGSDTFGKPDFAALNNINQPSNDSFNPMEAINNMDNKVQGNDGFAPPTGMSFGGDNSSVPSGNQAPVGASSSLVAFLDKMS